VEALKHKFRNVKEDEELRAALQARAEALTVELEAERAKMAACELDAATRTAALTATVLELQQLEAKWKADAQVGRYFLLERGVRCSARPATGFYYSTQGKWEGRLHFTALLTTLVPSTREWSYWLLLVLEQLCSLRFHRAH